MKTLKFLTLLMLVPSLCFGAGATSFDGSGDSIAYSFVPVTGSGNRTVCLWLKSSQTTDSVFITWGDHALGSAGTRWEFRLDGVNGDALRTEVNSGNERAVSDVTDSSWKWACQVLNGTDVTNVAHFLNGVDDGTAGSTARAINTASTCNTAIGRRPSGGCTLSEFDYSGLLSNISIYSTNLNDQKMQEIRFKPEFNPENNVFLDLMIDGGSSHREISTGARTGTVTGASDSLDGPPVMYGGGLPL